MQFFVNIYSVIVSPSKTFERFASEFNKDLLFQGIFVFLLATMIDSELSLAKTLDSIVNLILLAALVFLFGYVFKLKAKDFLKILGLSCFASVPIIFSAPIRLLGDVPFGIGMWLGFVLAIWIFSLNVIAISKACQIQKRKVLLFATIPIILFVTILVGSVLEIFFLF